MFASFENERNEIVWGKKKLGVQKGACGYESNFHTFESYTPDTSTFNFTIRYHDIHCEKLLADNKIF